MKSSVYIATSLDGFIARENGEIDWLLGSDPDGSGEDYGFDEFMASVDALVMGRYTFEQVLTFGDWPYGNKRVVVLSSRSLTLPDALPETVTTASGSPAEIIRLLEKQGARHLYIDGGKTIQRFLNDGLIQELIICTIPVLLGSGIPLFGPLKIDIKLLHEETRSFASGMVQSRYTVQGPKPVESP